MTDGQAQDLFDRISSGDDHALARAITLVESRHPAHRAVAETLLDLCLEKTGNAVRIGVTGVPGVGKSTFIETFGMEMIEKHAKKVAVLAIDPSSSRSKGSILGDKTRMTRLSANRQAFIRPSPSSGNLGGVGLATRESIALCESAGFDVIIVETVGVGQSETEVKEIVDFFLLLMLPGAGDELQGIKRGIMELADAIFINKADGDSLKMAREARSAYASALSLFQQQTTGWKTRVELCSALTGEKMDIVWDMISDFIKTSKSSGRFEAHRREQMRHWFKRSMEFTMMSAYFEKPEFDSEFQLYENKVLAKKISPRKASRLLIEALNDGHSHR